ncbi:lecithin retinol acyltransferase family protein [Zavarzinella formosa]|uniref:lecithin retinol acyltransferase family protein n=1 Tax=Zavarzinella formosa TaxID=360055 RepID=UPI0012FBBA3D|nr:lecithin retinol acyltransferase family protein [Zavarzinella formosa]
MAKGDHLMVPLAGLMTHHGIDMGDGTVVHWSSGLPGSIGLDNFFARISAAEVRRTSLEDFGDLSSLQVREYLSCDNPDTVIQRASGKIGEKGYCLFGNNCEHFATWCKTGESASGQVRDASAAALGLVGGGVRVAAVAAPLSTLLAPGMLMAASAVFPAAIALGLGWAAFNLFQSETETSVE